MRKVRFNKWIPKVSAPVTLYGRTASVTQEGTNCFETGFPNEGLFHQWGNAYEDSGEGFGNYTVALVEVADGTIVEVLPSNIKFVT